MSQHISCRIFILCSLVSCSTTGMLVKRLPSSLVPLPVELHCGWTWQPFLIGVDPIFNKAKSTSLLASKQFYGAHYEYYTMFYLSIALLFICWWYCKVDFHISAEFFEFFCEKMHQHQALFSLVVHTPHILFYRFSAGYQMISTQFSGLSEMCCSNLQCISNLYYEH